MIPMRIRRQDYYIRNILKRDKDLLKKWGVFSSPLLEGYNYANLNDTELDYWYYSKKFAGRSKYFSVLDYEGRLLGFIGFKDISYIRRSALLGIVFDPKEVSKGLGTRALDDLLDYYFYSMNMRKLYLEVNSWNDRAIKSYKKVGFKETGRKLEKFENQDILDSRDYLDRQEDFVVEDGLVYSKIIKMEISKKDYRRDKDGL